MANEKVSQMTSLGAAAVAPDDLLLITDTSEKESKKITTSDFLTYIESTGSFNAYHAALADSASSVLGTDVVGPVDTSSYSLNSNTSSYSIKTILADSASHADTASLTLTCLIHTTTADTASFLDYTGDANGTASFSLMSDHSILSDTSSTLLYIPGISKNTASYALSSSVSISSSFSTTSSYSVTSSFSGNSISSSYASSADTASNLLGFSNSVKAWAMVTWSLNNHYPETMSVYNISSFQWINRYDKDGIYYDQYGVVFSKPVSNSNYIMVSSQFQPYATHPAGYAAFLHPRDGLRTTSGFTMSVATIDTYNFYTYIPDAPYADTVGIVTFQILGL